MFWVIVAVIVVIVIVHNNNKKKRQAAGQQAPGYSPQEAGQRQWMRSSDTARAIVTRYRSYWAQGGPLYNSARSGELKIARFAVCVTETGIYEHVWVQDGTQFDSDLNSFAELSGPQAFTRLDQPAQRDELGRMICEGLAQFPWLTLENGVIRVRMERAGDAPKAAPQAQPARSSAPPRAGDPIDQAAFARAFAHMKGGDGAPAGTPKAESPKAAAPKKPEAPQPAPAGEDPRYSAFAAKILDYYRGLWNRESGSLYTELDTMPIRCFSLQVREDRLVESVWLEGDELPLVTDTPYDKLCGDTPVCPMNTPELQERLRSQIFQFLLGLGTVALQGDVFVPVRPGQSAPAGGASQSGGAPKGGGQGGNPADKDAQLRAQVQALLEKQKRDGHHKP